MTEEFNPLDLAGPRERLTYMFLLYWPPTAYRALLIWPRDAVLDVSMSWANRFSPPTAAA
jgi:hypothetical protein